jgi:hypothetical protein
MYYSNVRHRMYSNVGYRTSDKLSSIGYRWFCCLGHSDNFHQGYLTDFPLLCVLLKTILFVMCPPVYTVKKGLSFSRPLPGCHLPNSPWPGIIKLFPARESLVSDIPAGDGKIVKLFFTVYSALALLYASLRNHF